MKQCTRCGESKPLDQFGKDRRNVGGLKGACRACLRSVEAARRASNPDAVRALERVRYAKDPEPKRRRAAEWHRNNLDKARLSRRAWHVANLDSMRAGRQESVRRYRAVKLGATLGDVDLNELQSIAACYLCAEILEGAVHVDHVVPLSRGGAHSMLNLRPTHATCNLRKSDKLLSELDWYDGPTDLGQRSQ